MALHTSITQHKSKRPKKASSRVRKAHHQHIETASKKLEEMVVMMMMISNTKTSEQKIENPKSITTADPIPPPPTFPTWKLYENPFYTNSGSSQIHHQTQDLKNQRIHQLHLPISTRKIAASFWDLTFIKPLMESELELARAKIVELKTGLERERKARKKAESMNKKLIKELSEVKKGRESLELLCEELSREISLEKVEMDRVRKDMEEERKMLRVAEVLREERVQMKLADAKHLLEQKLHELETMEFNSKTDVKHHHHQQQHSCGSGDHETKAICNGAGSSSWSQRRGSPETENPHIKRGIKGFVEFPKVVRAIGYRSRHLGTKLECQKAQLRILLKHNLIPSSNLVTN